MFFSCSVVQFFLLKNCLGFKDVYLIFWEGQEERGRGSDPIQAIMSQAVKFWLGLDQNALEPRRKWVWSFERLAVPGWSGRKSTSPNSALTIIQGGGCQASASQFLCRRMRAGVVVQSSRLATTGSSCARTGAADCYCQHFKCPAWRQSPALSTIKLVVLCVCWRAS